MQESANRIVHQQLHVIRNTAHRPSMQASYTAGQVGPKRLWQRKLQQHAQYLFPDGAT